MKIAIYGYGNLGRGVECAVKAAPDMGRYPGPARCRY